MKKITTTVMLLFCILGAFAQSIDTDPVVKALEEEVKYSMEQLKAKPVPAYFMSLRMTHEKQAAIQSSFGVSSTYEGETRFVTPMVRVGSKELDNYKYVMQGSQNPYSRNENGMAVPVDKNIAAYRNGIWRETMQRYDVALRNYQNAVSKSQTEKDDDDKAPCFSDAPIERYYEAELPDNALDREKWKGILNRVTAVFKECRELEQGLAIVNPTNQRVYIVNSDGTAVVKNRQCYNLALQAAINAKDGMQCPLYETFFSYTEEGLPSEEVLIEKAKELVKRLLALKDAPVADPYAGPALLSSEASGVFFHEIFGHRLETHRMKRGSQTFKKMVGERVLPTEFSVYSDPTLKYYNGEPLNGYYLYDDEGTKAQRVQNVENGILKDFLCGRIPIDGFLRSNGHARASGGNDPLSRQSNLIIETSKPYTDAQLREMLIKEAKKQGKEYGYMFQSVTGGYTMTEGINSFNVTPLEVYRIYVDGRPDQLVRGVSLIGTPLAMFSGIEAGGQTPRIFTGSCGAESGWVPVTAISPMIYVSKIETQRNTDNKSIPHILPLPEYAPTQQAADAKDIIFKAMEDEMQRTKTSLKLDNQPLPYRVEYAAISGSLMNITCTSGGTVRTNYRPLITDVMTKVTLGDKMFSSSNGTPWEGVNDGLAMEINYDDIRRTLWRSSENAYKRAINDFGRKKTDRKKNVLPEEDQDIPEFMDINATEHIEPSCTGEPMDSAKYYAMARELSAIFRDYPRLTSNNVMVGGRNMDYYRYTSNGLRLRFPASTASIRVDAHIKLSDGSVIQDQLVVNAKSFSELPDIETMKKEVRTFADLLMKKADAEAVKEYYVGPVMLEDEAVNEVISRSMIRDNAIASRDAIRGSSKASMMVGKRVLDTKISITQLSGIEEYKDTKLAARYNVDCDGVTPAKSLPIVEKGILKTLLTGSRPAVSATQSTGNQLLMWDNNQSAVMPAIYRVECEKTVPMQKMKQQLINEAKKSGLDHAYIVKAPRYGWRYLVRLDIKTGEEKIVRVNNIPQPSRGDLMHITAASREEFVSNNIEYFNNAQCLCSTITPKAIIVENIDYHFMKPDRTEEYQLKNPAQR